MLDPAVYAELERQVLARPNAYYGRRFATRWAAALIAGHVDPFTGMALLAWAVPPACGWVRREWRVSRLMVADNAYLDALERIPDEDLRGDVSAPRSTSAVRETAERAPG